MLLPNIDGGVVSKARGDINVAPPLYDPEGSFHFDSREEGNMLQFRPQVESDRSKWCYSIWVKNYGNRYDLRHFTLLGVVDQNGIPSDVNKTRLDDALDYIYIGNNSTLYYQEVTNGSASATYRFSIPNLKDSAAWMHFFMRFDASRDALELFINGLFIGKIAVTKSELRVGKVGAYHYIGADQVTRADGYATDIALVLGEGELDVNAFGYEDNHGVWRPKDLHESLPSSVWKGSSFYLQPGKTSRWTEEAEGGIAMGNKYQRGYQRMKLGFKPDLVMVFTTKYGGAENADFFIPELPNVTVNAANVSGYINGDTNGVTFYDDGISMGTSGNIHNETQFPYSYLAFKKGPEYGLDVILYQGDSVSGRQIPHGLGQKPKAVWIIPLEANTNRVFHHIEMGWNKATSLEDPDATPAAGYIVGCTDKVVTVTDSNRVNTSSSRYIMVCFADVPGLQHNGVVVGPGDGTYSGSTMNSLGFHGLIAFAKRFNSGSASTRMVTNDWYRSISSQQTVTYPNNSANNPQVFQDNMFNFLTATVETDAFIARADTRAIYKACKSTTSNVQLVPRNASTHNALSDDSPFKNLGVWKEGQRSTSCTLQTGGLCAALGYGEYTNVRWSKSLRGRCYWEINLETTGSSELYGIGLTGLPNSFVTSAGQPYGYYGVYHPDNGNVYLNIKEPPHSDVVLQTVATGGHRHIYGFLWEPDQMKLTVTRDDVGLLFEQDFSAYGMPDRVFPFVRHRSGNESTVASMNDGRFPFQRPEDAKGAVSLMEDGLKPESEVKRSAAGFVARKFTASHVDGQLQRIFNQDGPLESMFFKSGEDLYLVKGTHRDSTTFDLNDELLKLNPKTGLFELVRYYNFANGFYGGSVVYGENGEVFVIANSYIQGTTSNRVATSGANVHKFDPVTETFEFFCILPGTAGIDVAVWTFKGKTFVCRTMHTTAEDNIQMYLWDPAKFTFELVDTETLNSCFRLDFFENGDKLYLVASNYATTGRRNATYIVDSVTGKMVLTDTVAKENSYGIGAGTVNGRSFMLLASRDSTTELFEWDQTNQDWSSLGDSGLSGNIYDIKAIEDNGNLYFAYADNRDSAGASTSYVRRYDPDTNTFPVVASVSTSYSHSVDYIKHGDLWYVTFSSYKQESNYNGWVDVLQLIRNPDTGILESGRRYIPMGDNYDFVWVKQRSTGNYNHRVFSPLWDGYEYYPNDSAVLTAFPNGIGFAHDDHLSLGNAPGVNQSAKDMSLWAWKTGPEFGFGVTRHVGTSETGSPGTYKHNCGGIPECLIIFQFDDVGANHVYFEGFASNSVLQLQSNVKRYDHPSAIYWEADQWDDENVVVHGPAGTNLGKDFGMIAIRSVPGYSAVGKYVGDGQVSGIEVDCGFKPAWVMIKIEDTSDNYWVIFDGARNEYNQEGMARFEADTYNPESAATNNDIYFTSTGFKCDGNGSSINYTRATYRYIAFAENPFEHTNGR